MSADIDISLPWSDPLQNKSGISSINRVQGPLEGKTNTNKQTTIYPRVIVFVLSRNTLTTWPCGLMEDRRMDYG